MVTRVKVHLQEIHNNHKQKLVLNLDRDGKHLFQSKNQEECPKHHNA